MKITIDHLRVITDAVYRGKLRKKLATFNEPGVLYDLNVMHEGDNSCCKLEPWEKTYTRLWDLAIANASGKNVDDVAAILQEHGPGTTLVGDNSIVVGPPFRDD